LEVQLLFHWNCYWEADVLATAIAPSWDDIGKLAAIAVLRTALNYFLEKELEHMHTMHPGSKNKFITLSRNKNTNEQDMHQIKL
jgi:hypothetical protein